MEQTIAAIATPNAPGGLSVIRISGPDAISICEKCFCARSGRSLSALRGYQAALGTITDNGQIIDEAVALVFRAPKSYTGENVVELSCHGGLYVTKEVLRVIISSGAVPAGPGEFTKRAFLNGKLSLTQAEAVADLIASQGKQTAQAALTAMQGGLYQKASEIKSELVTAAGHLSAWADYPEEEIPPVEQSSLEKVLTKAAESLECLLRTFDTGRLVRSGIHTVIAGRPNVGKSTLMNLLAGCQKSIVTDVAGTTRDVIEETVSLNGVMLNLYDTAGLRKTSDLVEQAGVALSRQKLEQADLVLALFDSSSPLTEEDYTFIKELEGHHVIAILNKTDLGQQLEESTLAPFFDEVVSISAKHADGLEALHQAISRTLSLADFDPFAPLLANERQRNAAERALNTVKEAYTALHCGMTLDAVTVSIEEAISCLLALTGERVTDTVVDEVFSHFCVGK